MEFLGFVYELNFNLIFDVGILPLWILPLGIIYAALYAKFSNTEKKFRFLFLVALSILCTCLVFVSNNLITMFINYELLTLSTIPLIFYKQNENTRNGLINYLGVLFFCSTCFLLPSILIINSLGNRLIDNHITSILGQEYSTALFILVLFGIAKTSMFPFQNWLLSAMVAEYPVSAILHSVAIVNAGLFFLKKVSVHIFGINFVSEIKIVSYLIAFGILYTGIKASLSSKLKELLAYSTSNQLHLAIFALFYVNDDTVSSSLFAYNHSYLKLFLFAIFSVFYLAFKINDVKLLSEYIRGRYFVLVALFGGISWFLIGLPYSDNAKIKSTMLLLAKGEFAYYVIYCSTFISLLYLSRVIYFCGLNYYYSHHKHY